MKDSPCYVICQIMFPNCSNPPRVVLISNSLPPPPKPPDRSVQIITVKCQAPGYLNTKFSIHARCDAGSEPPDSCNIAVVSNSLIHSKTGVMILLQIAKGFGYSLMLMNSWNLKTLLHCWRFVRCSKVSILRFYHSPIAPVGLIYFSKITAQQLFDEMPHTIMNCLNILLCEFIISGIMEDKQLLQIPKGFVYSLICNGCVLWIAIDRVIYAFISHY